MLENTVCCNAIRSKGEIVLPVALSGIAALLLPGGATAHSTFGMPLNVDEDSFCSSVTPDSELTELLIKTKLIIWDEVPMTHKHCVEALDRSLRDVMRFHNPQCASNTLPVNFQHRQFPVMVCYAMTINKSKDCHLRMLDCISQGRSLVFSHGQLYVAISRVTSKKGQKILICDHESRTLSTTDNVVYKEVFENL